MVRGIGIDVVEIERIDKLIEKYGSHFLEKVFTPGEIAYCNQKAHPALHFAGRWAAKEAFYKALPESFQPFATWKSIEVLPENASGRPEIRVLSFDVADNFQKEKITSLLISISHERTICTAIVILS
ncbi:MAG: holo-ACP synthase [Chitinispirillaceae bacterium]|nr:holo-ACP synthase [Chitinispirillaceae bacterium]